MQEDRERHPLWSEREGASHPTLPSAPTHQGRGVTASGQRDFPSLRSSLSGSHGCCVQGCRTAAPETRKPTPRGLASPELNVSLSSLLLRPGRTGSQRRMQSGLASLPGKATLRTCCLVSPRRRPSSPEAAPCLHSQPGGLGEKARLPLPWPPASVPTHCNWHPRLCRGFSQGYWTRCHQAESGRSHGASCADTAGLRSPGLGVALSPAVSLLLHRLLQAFPHLIDSHPLGPCFSPPPPGGDITSGAMTTRKASQSLLCQGAQQPCGPIPAGGLPAQVGQAHLDAGWSPGPLPTGPGVSQIHLE